MNKLTIKRATFKTAKVTGASLGLAWTVAGCAFIAFGSVLTVWQSAAKLKAAIQA